MDNPLEKFRNIKVHEAHLFLLCFIGCVSPGVISIWVYQPELIKEVGFLVLLLLSLSVSLPFTFMNYVVLDVDTDKEDQLSNFGVAAGILGTASFALILINIFIGFPIKHYVLLLAISNISISVISRRAIDKIIKPKEID